MASLKSSRFGLRGPRRQTSARAGNVTLTCVLSLQAMINAHLDSLFALATPFRPSSPSPFPFGTMGPPITAKIRSQIPVMLRERLTPPPEETYSLNRKLSGAFLLCERLASHVPVQEMYERARNR